MEIFLIYFFTFIVNFIFNYRLWVILQNLKFENFNYNIGLYGILGFFFKYYF